MLQKTKESKSISKPRTLSPVVSRFKGWFIDITDKAKPGKLDGVGVIEGISLASKSRDTSAWQFVETKKGYLVRAAAGKYKGWYIVVDDSAKTRPEGPTLTVTPALRLAKVSFQWLLAVGRLAKRRAGVTVSVGLGARFRAIVNHDVPAFVFPAAARTR